MVSGSLVECRNGGLRGEGALQVASVRADLDSLSGIRFDHQVCQLSERCDIPVCRPTPKFVGRPRV